MDEIKGIKGINQGMGSDFGLRNFTLYASFVHLVLKSQSTLILDRLSIMLKSAPTLLLLALILLVTPQANAQNTASFALQSDSKMWIDGTSNRSDWTVTATELSGFVMKNTEGSLSDPGIEQTEIVVSSAKIVSNKSSIMDRLMRKALKVQQHAEITYALKTAEVESSTDTGYTLQTVGDLTLAGVTNEIIMTVEGEEQADGQIRLKGSYPMLMSDFNIERPTAMYGSLRTGDEVTVHFDLLVAKDAEPEQE